MTFSPEYIQNKKLVNLQFSISSFPENLDE